MLLFSDIHLSLVHYYRVHKHGLPHIAFRRNYLSQLQALLPSPVTLPPARVVRPESSGSGLSRPVSLPEVVLDPARTMRRAHRWRRPVRVEEPAVVSVPVLTLQDPLAAMGAVVLDCRPSLLPVSMDISVVDMSAVRLPAMSATMDGLLPGREQLSTGGGGDLLGLICPELGVTPLVDPGTDLEDERPTPVGSPVAAIDEGMPLSPTLGADVEVARALWEMGFLPEMVTPIEDPALGFPLSPATYSVPPVPSMSVGDSLPLEVAAPVGLAIGSPARSEMPLHLVSPPASVASPGLPPSSSASRSDGVLPGRGYRGRCPICLEVNRCD